MQSSTIKFDYLSYLHREEPDYSNNKTVNLELINVTSTSPLNYSLAIDNKFFYFQFNLDRPSILSILFDLQIRPILASKNVAIQQFRDQQKFEQLNFQINHLLELPVRNSLPQIIAYKEKLLDYFKTDLWKVNDEKDNDRITIVYIVPDPSSPDTFLVGLGSQYKMPFKSDRVLYQVREKGTDKGWADVSWFRQQVQLNADFWRSQSHQVNFSRPQLAGPAYRPIEVKITLRAIPYNETDKEELKLRETLQAQSRANGGLITGSLVGFTFLQFVIDNSFWISIIWVSLLVNTAFTITLVYLNNSQM